MYRILHSAVIVMTFALLPFIESIGNRSEGMLGKIGHDGSFYPLFVGVILWICYVIYNNERIFIPNNISFKIMFGLILWLLFASVCNFDSILNAYFQNIRGLNRFVVQYGLLIFCCLIPLYIYNIYRKLPDFYGCVKLGLDISIIISVIYIVFEFGYFFHVEYVGEFLVYLNSIFRGDDLIYFKIRSLAGEASLFGFYISFITPYILYMCAVKCKKIYVLYLFCIMAGMVCSFSRTSYVVAIVEIIIFTLIFYRKILERKNFFIKMNVCLFMVGLLIANTLAENSFVSDYNVLQIIESLTSNGDAGVVQDASNLARYGSQLAAWQVFLANPFLGVGWGQEGYYIPDYYPQWSWGSSEITMWADNGKSYAIPSTFNVLFRFLCGGGLIGGILWIFLWISECYRLFKWKDVYFNSLIMEDYKKIVFIIMIGTVLLWGAADQVRFFGMWVALGVSWILTEERE